MDNSIKIARALYRPTRTQEKLVTQIALTMQAGNVKELVFPKNLELAGLKVKSVELEKSHSCVLVHWHPDHNVSTKSDPFCSAYILQDDELKTLLDAVKHELNTN